MARSTPLRMSSTMQLSSVTISKRATVGVGPTRDGPLDSSIDDDAGLARRHERRAAR